jgi:hypothetical protein
MPQIIAIIYGYNQSKARPFLLSMSDFWKARVMMSMVLILLMLAFLSSFAPLRWVC